MSAMEEHIVLSSEEPVAEPPAGAPGVLHRMLEQHSRCKGYRARVELFDERFVSVSTRRLGARTDEYWLDLRCIDPTPRRATQIAWGWFALALTLLTGGGVLLAAVAYSGHPLLDHPAAPGAITASLAGAFALWMGVVCSARRLVWFTRHGRIPVVQLLAGSPDRAQVRAFADELEARARRARAVAAPDPSARLSAELREHRRLRDQQALDPDTYERAKRRILRCHGAPPESRPGAAEPGRRDITRDAGLLASS